MIVASLTFLTPWGALLALTALVPLGALALAARRQRQARELLGLRAPAVARRWVRPLLVTAVFALLGLAAAQPVLRSTTAVKVRTDSEAFFVIDVSRSMLASRTPSSTRRIARARADAIRLRHSLLDVPSGVAALTDQVLPYLMPVPDAGSFEQTVNRAVAVGQPPPSTNAVTATNLGALGALGTQSFFSPGVKHRVAIVLTDGESRPFDQQQTARSLGRMTPIFIKIGSSGESVYDGKQPESAYHPDPAAGLTLSGLAQAAGGKVFGESQLGVGPMTDGPYGDLTTFWQEARGAAPGGEFSFRHGLAPARNGGQEYIVDIDFYDEDVEFADTMARIRELHDQNHRFFRWVLGPEGLEALRRKISK